ncbi:uncharacterized protein LOC119609676 isoform X2 [Lucilia sericata]|uniref:uncharacterized protein LOC119609676 isoform X2 n=1 Tax=Lucilia sericata TaxID=13632 RepID=UPI0018A83255|nr:uncharacterized protein LOC119609676 isoform X2 [Lucilia sericata]
MPRSTAKSKAKNGNVNVKSCNVSKKNTTTKTPKDDIKKEKCLKKEVLVADTAKEAVTEEVVHRKSERRRVARDIFLVFEETNSRRRTRGANKKQTKPKFGHLKVEDPIKTKGLLRDIKNEPRCYLNGTDLSVSVTVPPVVPVLKRNANKLNVNNEDKKLKSEKIKTAACITENKSYSKKSINVKPIKISTAESQPCILDNEKRIVARVNPIFLWVKQDDTRIVEVRCEDYDKRNRIRITKTSNGWRAIPRSDPTSSKVLKFYPTPLMKVKRENHNHETNNNIIISSQTECNETLVVENYAGQKTLPENAANQIDAKINVLHTVYNPLATKDVEKKIKNKKSKKLKKKTHSEKSSKKSKANVTAIQNIFVNSESKPTPLNTSLKTNSSDERNGLICSNTNAIRSEPEIYNESEKSLSTPDFIENINDKDFEVTSELESTYQKESEEEFSFHLCPKTGLFLPNNEVSISEYHVKSIENKIIQDTSKTQHNTNNDDLPIDIAKVNADSMKSQIVEENPESLEDKTKNLKDLLDDADLLQHCDDNANSDAELIDTLVKTSCENNLIQANEIITKASMDQMHQKTLEGTNEMVVQLIADVSDPPKCLSFNEAGEIEGLNGELFQSNTYMEAFDKQSHTVMTEPHITLHSTTSVVETSESPQRPLTCENIEPILEIMDVNNSKVRSVNVIEDSPKDLSYKKREEVCPPSESRSQCAVTSSSDVIKSPQREGTPSLSASSETLKNLILEQFMKLNALSTQHQRDPIDLGKQRHHDISNMKSIYTSKQAGQTNDFIETVVIEDDDDGEQEPLKKRLRLNKNKVVPINTGKMTMIDKDPDPLTQLRLLIRNTQWKVPDPILVPKDRLSAVLASPAREIPLLITTRPELRLPEAFAYPEIIQNPNILVISMAQLEAILKNEVEAEKTTSSKIMETDVNQQLSEEQIAVQLNNHVNELQSQLSRQHIELPLKQSIDSITTDTTGISSESISETRKENAKCSQQSTSLSSELNSATMAVLNQMLWLPYFGQISQDIVKSLKNPIVLQEKCANLVPFFNSHLNGLTNIEDVYKNAAMNSNKISTQSASNSGLQSFQEQIATNDELSLFQKIVQHQMQSVLQLNQLKADSSQLTAPLAAINSVSSLDKTNSNIESLSNLIEQKKQKVILPNNKQTNPSPTVCKNLTNNCSSNSISVAEKSYNLRSSVAGRHSTESKQYSNNHRQNTVNKPRLTCKSLSNLLDPEHSMAPLPNSSTVYVQNLSSDFQKNANEMKRNSAECKVSDRNMEGKGNALNDLSTVPPSARPCSVTNLNIEASSEFGKQKAKPFVDSIAPENNNVNNDASGLTTDTNIPLWHPLFGSNTKTAYSSPWQWTTVTATGE